MMQGGLGETGKAGRRLDQVEETEETTARRGGRAFSFEEGQ
jgi:hypothetical protein